MSGWYRLDEAHNPVPIEIMDEADREGIESQRHIKRTAVTNPLGKFVVSTIFLGLDHGRGGAPVLFETMVFVTDDDESVSDFTEQDAERYSTYDEALIGHDRMVEKWSVANV